MILVRKFCRDQSGATALEYGLIAALVSVASVVAMSQLGASLVSIYTALSTHMDDAASTVP